METERNRLSALTRPQCMELLGRGGVGRIAVTVGALPAIFPVNYAVRDGNIYFRTGPGTKLAAATQNAVVAFEVDSSDLRSGNAWSVLAVGTATEVTDANDLETLATLPLPRWTARKPETLVRIQPELLSGREVTNPELAAAN